MADGVMSDDDALATFFGVLKSADPEFAQQLQQELADAAKMVATHGPAGLDKGGYWAAAAMLGKQAERPPDAELSEGGPRALDEGPGGREAAGAVGVVEVAAGARKKERRRKGR